MYLETAQQTSLLQPDAKGAAEKPWASRCDTEPSADKDSMCDREDDNHAEQEPEEIRDETLKRSLPKRFTKSQGIL